MGSVFYKYPNGAVIRSSVGPPPGLTNGGLLGGIGDFFNGLGYQSRTAIFGDAPVAVTKPQAQVNTQKIIIVVAVGLSAYMLLKTRK